MTEFFWVLYSAGYLTAAVVMLWVAKKVFDLCTPYSVNVQLTGKNNAAVGVLITGFLLGVMAVICGVIAGPAPDEPTLVGFFQEIQLVVIYGAIGVVLLFLAGIINDKVILCKFSNRKEIIDSRNAAVATVMAGTYIASGLIVAGALQGSPEDLPGLGDLVTLLVAFAIGQLALVVFSWIYQRLTAYDNQKELGEGKNLAAGVAFGGNLLAFGLILMKSMCFDAAAEEEWTWVSKLLHVGYYAGAGCVLLVLARLVTDLVFLPKVRITKEIVQDKNLNAGLMEAGLAAAMGTALVFCL